MNDFVDHWPDYNVVVKLADLYIPKGEYVGETCGRGIRYDLYEDTDEYGCPIYDYQVKDYVSIDANTKIAIANLPAISRNLQSAFGEYKYYVYEEEYRPYIYHIEAVHKFCPKITGGKTDFDDMFRGCTYLKKVNLTGLNNTYSQNFSCMFYGCTSLEFVDMSTITIRVGSYGARGRTSLYSMFAGCTNLKKIYMPNADIPGASNLYNGLSGMFKDCNNLNYIRCTQYTKELLTNAREGATTNSVLPAAMLPGGSGVWDIVEIGGGKFLILSNIAAEGLPNAA